MTSHPDSLHRGTVTARTPAAAGFAAHGGSAPAGRLPRWRVEFAAASARTSGGLPRSVQLARTCGSRFRRVSSSASTTDRRGQCYQPGDDPGHQVVMVRVAAGHSLGPPPYRRQPDPPVQCPCADLRPAQVPPDPRQLHGLGWPSSAANPPDQPVLPAPRVEQADPAAHGGGVALQQRRDLGTMVNRAATAAPSPSGWPVATGGSRGGPSGGSHRTGTRPAGRLHGVRGSGLAGGPARRHRRDHAGGRRCHPRPARLGLAPGDHSALHQCRGSGRRGRPRGWHAGDRWAADCGTDSC